MRLAGGVTAAYLNANPWYSAANTWADAQRAIGTELEHLNFIVIDFELRPEPANHEGARLLMEHTHELIRLVRGSFPGKVIGYSADWFLGFFKTLGWTRQFALDGYWYASYDNVVTIGEPAWRMASPIVGKQYMNDTYFDGVVTDLNVFDDGFINTNLAPEKEDDMLSLTPDDRLWFGGLSRGLVQALANGRLNSSMRDGDEEWEVPITLQDVLNAITTSEETILAAIADIGAPTGGAHSHDDE
jgi:hypothetical protein